jgi:hypothetical protein
MSGLKPFTVRFDDWTIFRLEVMAEDEEHAITIAQSKCTGDLWEAEAIDGGQEGWQAFPATPRRSP